MTDEEDAIEMLIGLSHTQAMLEEAMGEPGVATGTEAFGSCMEEEPPPRDPNDPLTPDEQSILDEFRFRAMRALMLLAPPGLHATGPTMQEQLFAAFNGRDMEDPLLKTDIHAFIEERRPECVSGDWITVDLDVERNIVTVDVVIPEGVIAANILFGLTGP